MHLKHLHNMPDQAEADDAVAAQNLDSWCLSPGDVFLI